MYVYIDAPIVLGVLYMYVRMHVCMHYVCMHVCTPFGALCGIDVSQVKYACIENVCIYRRADSTGSTIYACMHACMYVCTPIGATFGGPIAKEWRADC